MRIAALLVLSCLLAFIFLCVGLWGWLNCEGWFVQNSVEQYCASVSANVGSAGLDAFLIGLLALAITVLMEDRFERGRFQSDLNRKRGTAGSVTLEGAFSRYGSKLDLSGHKFTNEMILGQRVRQLLLGSRRGNGASLSGISFRNCDLRGINARGCTLNDVSIRDSTLRDCSFKECTISSSRADRPFLANSQGWALCFDSAKLSGVNLASVSIGQCSFWRANLADGSKFPESIFERLERTGAVVAGDNGSWLVSGRWQIISDCRRACQQGQKNPKDPRLVMPISCLVLARIWLALLGMRSHSPVLDRLLAEKATQVRL